MATSKTLTPTNVTISIPAMTDAPDASVFSNCVDKEADAINSINSNYTSQLKSNTFTNNVDANNYTNFGFYHVGISTNSPESSTAYGMLLVFTGGTGFVAQIFISTNNTLHYRYRNNSSSNWLAWKKLTGT